MTQEVKPQDHPDFVGGWIWTELEIRWIKERMAEAILAEREACADAALKAAESSIVLAMKIEREACAQVCEDLPAPDIYSNTDMSMWDVTCMDCAEAIRARGQA
jgi:hypothetical protein